MIIKSIKKFKKEEEKIFMKRETEILSGENKFWFLPMLL